MIESELVHVYLGLVNLLNKADPVAQTFKSGMGSLPYPLSIC